MRSIPALALGLFLFVPLAAGAETALATPPSPERSAPEVTYRAVEVADGVVMAVHSYGANLTCVAHPSGLVFVDAGLSTRLAARFRADMEQRFARPTKALVLTHAHLDHVLGMGAFADVPVVAASAGRPFLERLVAIQWTEEAVAGAAQVFPTLPEVVGDAKPFLPTVWFEDEHPLATGEHPLVVRRTGGHTACSSHLWWSERRLVVAGDLVQAGRRPYFGDPATNLRAWVGALDGWIGGGTERVVPGHGSAVGRAELVAIRDYFVELRRSVAALKARGVPVEAAGSDPSLPTGYWPASDPLPKWWPACVAAAYREP